MAAVDLRAPAAMLRIAAALERAGFETWAVGGAVRDAVLGLPATDWDLATRAPPKHVRKLFRRTVPLGIEHGTVGVIGDDEVVYEVTTFRRDVETFGRHAVVEFADSIEEDLARRDFTFNALAWSPASGELRDPFAGVEDLKSGTLRTVGRAPERFAEDYLRVLRALRFAGHFELTIEPETWSALTGAVGELSILSAERVREELSKVLGKTRQASRALSLYAAAGVLPVLYPELEPLVGLGDPPDAWSRSLLAVDVLPPTRRLVRVAALLHAIGMPGARTRDLRGGWRYTGHERAGARLADQLMRRLKFSNAERERVVHLVEHQSDLFPPDAPDAVVRKWLRFVGRGNVEDLFRLRSAVWRASPDAAPDDARQLASRMRRALSVARVSPVLSVSGLAVGGHELQQLGIAPGPAMGALLEALLERVLDDPQLNTREALTELVLREYLPQ